MSGFRVTGFLYVNYVIKYNCISVHVINNEFFDIQNCALPR